MAGFPYDVFLSYNSAQKEWVLDLARRLRDSGFNVWFDEWRLRGSSVRAFASRYGCLPRSHRFARP